MAEIKPGLYKGRARAGSAQYGLSGQNQPQVAIDFDLFDEGGRRISTITLALSLHKNAAPFTFDRLRACGWQGSDVMQLDGVETRDVPISIAYDTFQGRTRMRAEIVTQGGTFKLAKEIPAGKIDAFKKYAAGLLASYEAERKNKPQGEAAAASEPETADNEVPF